MINNDNVSLYIYFLSEIIIIVWVFPNISHNTKSSWLKDSDKQNNILVLVYNTLST